MVVVMCGQPFGLKGAIGGVCASVGWAYCIRRGEPVAHYRDLHHSTEVGCRAGLHTPIGWDLSFDGKSLHADWSIRRFLISHTQDVLLFAACGLAMSRPRSSPNGLAIWLRSPSEGNIC